MHIRPGKYLSGWVVGWLAGWISLKYSQLSPAKAGVEAELGNIDARMRKFTENKAVHKATILAENILEEKIAPIFIKAIIKLPQILPKSALVQSICLRGLVISISIQV